MWDRIETPASLREISIVTCLLCISGSDAESGKVKAPTSLLYSNLTEVVYS